MPCQPCTASFLKASPHSSPEGYGRDVPQHTAWRPDKHTPRTRITPVLRARSSRDGIAVRSRLPKPCRSAHRRQPAVAWRARAHPGVSSDCRLTPRAGGASWPSLRVSRRRCAAERGRWNRLARVSRRAVPPRHGSTHHQDLLSGSNQARIEPGSDFDLVAEAADDRDVTELSDDQDPARHAASSSVYVQPQSPSSCSSHVASS
jgi:hypothetical protein